jgi:hypothetical protein
MIIHTWDPKGEELAEPFLADEPYPTQTTATDEARVKSLARAIQQAIEDWLDDRPAAGDRA